MWGTKKTKTMKTFQDLKFTNPELSDYHRGKAVIEFNNNYGVVVILEQSGWYELIIIQDGEETCNSGLLMGGSVLSYCMPRTISDTMIRIQNLKK